MKRILALILALALLLPTAWAAAEAPAAEASAAETPRRPVMAGYDPADTGHDWNNNRFFLAMETLTGQEFVYRQYKDEAEYRRFKEGLPTAETLPAVFFKAAFSNSEVLALYRAGVLIDLAPLLEENAPHLWQLLQEHPAWRRAITLPDGAIAALPLLDPLMANDLVWINRRWLTLLQKDVPTTPEELTEVLRAFKTQDPNRNGKQDEVPMTFTGMWELRFLQHGFGLITNDYGQTLEGERVVCGWTGEKNRAFLAWARGLMAEGLLDRTGFYATDTSRTITDVNAAIPYGVIFGSSPMELLPTAAAADYTALVLRSGQAEPVYRDFMGGVAGGTFALTPACDDPAAMLRWVDYLYTEDGCYLARSGELEVDYQRDSEGKWFWLYSPEQVLTLVQRQDTIDSGTPIPGWVPASYSLSFDNPSTRPLVEDFAAVAAISREAVPQVYFTPEEEARLAELWPPLSTYCETRMTWFVTGDWPLDDEHWAEYCRETERLGMPEVTAIWQQALDRQKEAAQ